MIPRVVCYSSFTIQMKSALFYQLLNLIDNQNLFLNAPLLLIT